MKEREMGVLRTLAERLSRGRVLRRYLPERFGRDPIYVSPDSALRYWRRDLRCVGGDLFAFVDEFVEPGHVVWDVGANVGLLAFSAAGKAGPSGEVVAIEADAFCVGLLRRTARAASGQRSRVEVLPAAVSDRLGIADFHIARRGKSANFLGSSKGSSQTGGIRETVQVITITLDWLLGIRTLPNVVKIDVEGAEGGVIEGSERLLSEVKPVILCEVSEDNAENVTDRLRSNGYRLYDFENRPGGEIQRATYNTLAFPPGPGFSQIS